MEKSKSKKKALFLLGMAGLYLLLKPNKKSLFIDDRYSDWSLTRSTIDEYDTRDLNQIEQIVVHHSASLDGTAEDFAEWHVRDHGWPGIGYHFVVEKDGSIIMGNPLTNVSYHTQNQNTKSVGIVLSGNFEVEQPTQAQMTSLSNLIAYLRDELPNELEVYGHRDFAATACPGDNLYNQLNQFKLAA